MQYHGQLYRALNPIFAREPLSGRGAKLYGGRFNAKGVEALYTATAITTAIREANQVGSLQPTTLVAYEARFDNVFDARDAAALARFGMDLEAISDSSWRDQMQKGEARTQSFARELVRAGFDAMLVRSFAIGASVDDLNLVIWRWSAKTPAQLILIDDENRLAR